jgi:hypothetical protein
MFLEANLEALLQTQPNDAMQALIERLKTLGCTESDDQTDTLPDGWDVCLSDDGQLTLLTSTGPLHHPQQVLHEATEAVRTLCQAGSKRIHVLVGLGLGYVLQALCQQAEGSVWVLETDSVLLRFVLQNINLAPYFATGRVRLYCDSTLLASDLNQVLAGRGLDIVALPGCIRHYDAQHGVESFNALASRLFDLENQAKLDWNTFTNFKPLWTQRFLSNLPYTPQSLSFASLKQALLPHTQGKTALIIARGPSLDEALPALAQAINTLPNVVTFAVGGALRPLLQAGITPNFALFCDTRHMQEQLHDLALPTDDITFLLNPVTQTCCFTAPSQATVLLHNAGISPYCDWLQAALNEPITPDLLPGGSTVSMFALNVAQQLGCGTMVLLGQDLALKGQQIYAGGITAEPAGDKHLLIYPPEAERCKIPICAYEWTTIAGQNGETLTTTLPFALFAKQLEYFAQQAQQQDKPITLVNASVGGAFLQGFTHCAVDQWLGAQATALQAKHSTTLCATIQQTVDHLKSQQQQHVSNRQQQLGVALNQLLHHVSQAQAACHSLMDACDSAIGATVLGKSHWQHAFNTAFNTLEALHQGHPFLAYLTVDYRWPLNEADWRGQPNAIASATPQQLETLRLAYQQCLAFYQQQLLPTIQMALTTLGNAPTEGGVLNRGPLEASGRKRSTRHGAAKPLGRSKA